MRAKIMVRGIVQGVGFRPFVYRLAEVYGLSGFVRNRGDAGVEILVEGSDSHISQFIIDVESKAPSIAQIFSINVAPMKGNFRFSSFSIMKSSEEARHGGSTIPFDVAICDTCLQELLDPQNRRYGYFFITCTQCGPRYTAIEALPYDRPNTTMRDFPMCKACQREYQNPLNRRFHAQTIACPICGPKIMLTTPNGDYATLDDPIRTAGELLHEGTIIAIKGNGGFHIATSSLNEKPITRLRNVKHRAQKPFAVMARNLETAQSLAIINQHERALLTSSIRPIVLLRKRPDFSLSHLVSPGLHNIGVMLPYTGLHHILFSDVSDPAFILTSANAPNEPIIIDNQDAYQRLGDVVDYFLLHDREISQRCDDSVLRVNINISHFLRRSRGYTPAPIDVPNLKGCSLGMGAKENVSSCLVTNNRAYISQYIGDVENIKTLQFLQSATDHLLYLTKSQVQIVGCDLHPQFSTRVLADAYGKAFNCPVKSIQHHYAHILALLGEWAIDEMIGIVCDGAGYGIDSTIWGGEILHCNRSTFHRLGHLQPQPMVGGDLATRYPLRMAAGILHDDATFQRWLFSQCNEFPYGIREINILTQQLERHGVLLTSSCGRVLDAVAAILNVCRERTYSGEPAMKLEACAYGGRNVIDVTPIIEKSVVNTSEIVRTLFASRDVFHVKDLAYSIETYLARGLADLAVSAAERRGVKVIGFSGGVAYNEHICCEMKQYVEREGYIFKIHERIPPGDGGIAFGQAVGALQSQT